MDNSASTMETRAGWRAPLYSSRLWIAVMWAVAWGLCLAGWDRAERMWAEAAADQAIVLLPVNPPQEREREEARGKVAKETGVGTARWLSPAEWTKRVRSRHGEEDWSKLLPTDQAWLPWLLEVQPVRPLDGIGEIQSFIARRRQEGIWQSIVWDGERIQRWRDERNSLRVLLGLIGLIDGLCGAAALGLTAPPVGGKVGLWLWQSAGGAALPAAIMEGARLAGGPVDGRCVGLAAAAGFILAGLIAPMIRRPEKRERETAISGGEVQNAGRR